MNLLKLWLAFFLLAVGNGEDSQDGGAADGGDAGAGDDSGAGDSGEGQGDDNLEAGDGGEGDVGEGDDGGQQQQRQSRAARYDEAEVERRVQERMQQQQGSQQRQQVPKHVAEEQAIFEQEEQRLRDPKITPLERWQIESNRSIRSSQRTSQDALARAQDTEDRTSFRLACSQNKRLASVAGEVEQAVQQLRARGEPPVAREALAAFILGQKVLKAGAAPAKKPAAPAPAAGRTPPARPKTDVRGGKNANSEREKRVARLQNVNI